MKKLLIALGLGSALLITPALAQTDQNATPGAAAPAAEAPMKSKAHHHKAKHHTMKKSKAKKEMAPADANAPKTQ